MIRDETSPEPLFEGETCLPLDTFSELLSKGSLRDGRERSSGHTREAVYALGSSRKRTFGPVISRVFHGKGGVECSMPDTKNTMAMLRAVWTG